MGRKFEKSKNRSKETTRGIEKALETGEKIVEEKERAGDSINRIPEGVDDEVAQAIEPIKKAIVIEATADLSERAEKPVEDGKKELNEINEEADTEAQRAAQASEVFAETKGDYANKEVGDGIAEANKSQEGFEKTIAENEQARAEAEARLEKQRADTLAAI